LRESAGTSSGADGGVVEWINEIFLHALNHSYCIHVFDWISVVCIGDLVRVERCLSDIVCECVLMLMSRLCAGQTVHDASTSMSICRMQ